LAVYLLWCLATGFWSQVPTLSLLKVAALAVSVMAFIGGGRAWVRRMQPEHPINYLLPVLGAALFAVVFSRGHPEHLKNGVVLYRGLTGNPNYLGILAAASLPVPLYESYLAWRSNDRRRQIIWTGVAALIMAALWWSASRASILCALFIVAAFIVVVTPGRRSMAALLVLVGAVSIWIAAPEVEQGVYERVVVKSSAHGDAFFSRRMTWERTYDAAKQGGVLGLGYGVSAGFNDFSVGLTANRYGREKGNAQLGVWEETGLIGLALYGLLLLAMSLELGTAYKHITNQDQRVEYVLLLGLLVGLIAQSVFEAWWSSPGSLESCVFWSTAGVAAGLAKRYTAQQPIFSVVSPAAPAFNYRPGVRQSSTD
jgi:O-antigen ligase